MSTTKLGRSARVAPAQDTYIFDIASGRRGAAINRLCGSLVKESNRDAFRANPEAYCDKYPLSQEQRAAILNRDWTAMLDLGASIFYTFKLAQFDKLSMQYLGGVFSGMSEADFITLMRSGGRNFG